ncbi:5-keto-4-deoxy-D-glucarate aldolase [bioreactor metagenome]|uniref:5-keto-4-deoxy-D-glucarate aldolase n=1 Tax=bioreactor metagenome TaxID=1076179 RepID=A0A645IBP8_9ZZZZ
MAARVEELCEIPQIDVLFVGPGDLSQSLGKPGKLEDPEVVALVEHVFKIALAKGKKVGIYCGGPAAVERYVGMGATYIAYGSDVNAFSGAVNSIRKSLKKD